MLKTLYDNVEFTEELLLKMNSTGIPPENFTSIPYGDTMTLYIFTAQLHITGTISIWKDCSAKYKKFALTLGKYSNTGDVVEKEDRLLIYPKLIPGWWINLKLMAWVGKTAKCPVPLDYDAATEVARRLGEKWACAVDRAAPGRIRAGHGITEVIRYIYCDLPPFPEFPYAEYTDTAKDSAMEAFIEIKKKERWLKYNDET